MTKTEGAYEPLALIGYMFVIKVDPKSDGEIPRYLG